MDRPVAPDAIAGLSAIAPLYRAVLCDVWGVVHDGIKPFLPAVDALRRFRDRGGFVVLITNGPRPSWSIGEQLDQIGVDRAGYDAIVSSGDVAQALLHERAGAKVYHLGPDRDFPLYRDVPIELTDDESAELVCCTGLFNDETETAADYEPLLRRLAARQLTFVCANPDIVVERGDRLIPCAGALAEIYARFSGPTIVLGKPHPEIYEMAMARFAALAGGPVAPEDILAIGDGAATDLRGANRAGFGTLFITSGIHSAEYGGAADPERVRAFLARNQARANGIMPRLAW